MVENQLGWYFQNLYNWKWLEIIMSNHPFSTGWPWPWGSRMSSLLFGGNGQFGGSSPKDFFTPEIFTPKKIHCERTLRISSELYITNQLFSTYTYSVRSLWIYIYMHASLFPKAWCSLKPTTKGLAAFPLKKKTYSSSNTQIQVKNGSIKSDSLRSRSTHIPIHEIVKWLLIWWQS